MINPMTRYTLAIDRYAKADIAFLKARGENISAIFREAVRQAVNKILKADKK